MCNNSPNDLKIMIFRYSSSYNPTILAPESMANKTYTEVLDTMIPWTVEYRDQFQHKTRYGNQIAYCGLGGINTKMTDPIVYHNTSKDYAPVDECAHRNAPGKGNKPAVHPFIFAIVACIVVAVRKSWI